MNASFRLWFSLHLLTALSVLLAGCSSGPPPKSTHDNLCSIYYFDDDWYDAAEDSYERWGIPPYVLMAFVHQESRFKPDAQPDRPYFLGFIPLPRTSSAYGYAQAQDAAWHDYQKATGRWGADRDDIDDALDFIGWYNNRSNKLLGIAKTDAYNLYLAYHEGHGGYKRKTYNSKAWLKKVARKVSSRANLYKKQSGNCR